MSDVSEKPWLGLYVIVKNSELTIRNLLASIKGVYDEIVFVDTGSTDRTREVLAEHFSVNWPDGTQGVSTSNGSCRVRLDRFDWVDDFSAARQYAFDLGTAKWRMYLDADDRAEFEHLRRMISGTEKDSPASNCISLKYDYASDEMVQDVIRVVRWQDGWRWEDPVHEHMVPVNHPRIISKYVDVWVRHEPNDKFHSNRSFERNIRIAEKAYAEAATVEKKALWAYYLANYAAELGSHDMARQYFREVGDGLGRNNITCEGLCRWARMEMRLGNFEKAIDLAAEAIGKAPELPDGLAALGVAQLLAGAPYRAVGIFDMLRAQEQAPIKTQHDAVWLDGIVNARAAQAYYQTGRVKDAQAALARVPQALIKHPEIYALVQQVAVSLQKTEGFDRLRALWEFLIWDTEPIKARKLLTDLAPASIADSPQVQQLLRDMGPKLKHMDSWNEYQRAYASIPDDPYHVPEKDRHWTLLQGRARALRQWAEVLPKEGPAVQVLVIGIQDGIIEGAMMEANSRISITACDVAPQASLGINDLKARFPGRVETHRVEKNHYDWLKYQEQGDYDAVVLFEVLEHLPSAADAMRVIRKALRPGGKLFLSTPIASSWVESYLSDLQSPRPWWHVRAFNPSMLWNLFYQHGFRGALVGLHREELFLAVMERVSEPRGDEDIAIYVYPQRPLTQGFDPFSPKFEHVGGSEEAVIHLSAAIARFGIKVTVYTDMPDRKDKLFVHQGVQWRPHSEFDVASLKGALLVWRAPTLAASFKASNPKLKVLNWLHDTHSACAPEVYEAVDGTIVLSAFHAEAVRKLDGFQGPLLTASNGIDPSEFPEPDESKRDPHAAIYAAAPERGLEFLLEAWPSIRERVPDATLRVYYSWALTERMLEKRPNEKLRQLLAKLRAKMVELKSSGVTYIGGVDHKTLNEAYRTSGVWTYPPVAFHEISCISALRAQASGCYPVIVPTGALDETCPHGDRVAAALGSKIYADAVVHRMLSGADPGTRSGMRKWALEQSWDEAAEKFVKIAAEKSKHVTIYAGGFGRQFDASGSGDGKPLGGSEEAVIAMAKELQSRGIEVVVYAPLPVQTPPRVHGQGWRDSSTFNPAGAHGTLLAWRCPALVPMLKGNGYPVILWLMDPGYPAKAIDYEEADAVIYLTETHKQIIEKNNGFIHSPSAAHLDSVIPVALPELPKLGSVVRDPSAVMWATSPDRGLLEFLREVWPQVIEQEPTAHLHVFYGLEPLIRAGKHKLAEAIRAEIHKCFSVTLHGGVPDAELYTWYQRCGIFAYRAVGFEETQCISLCKALALGCYPVVNSTGCLEEIVSRFEGLAVKDEAFTGCLIHSLGHPISGIQRGNFAGRIRFELSASKMGDQMVAQIEELSR